MANFNRVTLAGQLGHDPKLSFTTAKKAVVKLSIATADEWLDDKGVAQKKSQWHQVVYFGKHAQSLVEKLKITKGDSVLVEGKLDYDEYTNKENVNIPTTQIVASKVQLLRRLDKK